MRFEEVTMWELERRMRSEMRLRKTVSHSHRQIWYPAQKPITITIKPFTKQLTVCSSERCKTYL